MLLKLSLLALLLPACLASTPDDRQTRYEAQERLYRDLFFNYNKFIIPVKEFDAPLNLTAGLVATSMDFNDKAILDMSVILMTSWEDERLAWEPEDYHGIESIHLPADKIWVHDLEVFNAIRFDHGSFSDAVQDGNKKYQVLVKYDGTVIWAPLARLQLRLADTDYANWPWGEYRARIRLGSWAYSTKYLRLVPYKDVNYIIFRNMKEDPTSPVVFTKKSFQKPVLATTVYEDYPDEWHSLDYEFYVQHRTLFTPEFGPKPNPNDIYYFRF